MDVKKIIDFRAKFFFFFFLGVSICNINRMSRKAVEIFAQELYANDKCLFYIY